MSEKTEYEFCYKTTLKNVYGLTDKWIARLGEPDRVVPNPYRKSQNSYLYSRRRVEDFVELHRDEIENLQVARARRSEVATAVAVRKREQLLAMVQGFEINMGHLPGTFERLSSETLEAGNNFLHYRGRDEYQRFVLSPNAIVAHLRHVYTNYDRLLNEIEGKVGKFDAYYVIRDRVNGLIESALREAYGQAWTDFTEAR